MKGTFTNSFTWQAETEHFIVICQWKRDNSQRYQAIRQMWHSKPCPQLSRLGWHLWIHGCLGFVVLSAGASEKGPNFKSVTRRGRILGNPTGHPVSQSPYNGQPPWLLVWGCFHAGQRITVRSEHLQLQPRESWSRESCFDHARKAVLFMRL